MIVIFEKSKLEHYIKRPPPQPKLSLVEHISHFSKVEHKISRKYLNEGIIMAHEALSRTHGRKADYFPEGEVNLDLEPIVTKKPRKDYFRR